MKPCYETVVTKFLRRCKKNFKNSGKPFCLLWLPLPICQPQIYYCTKQQLQDFRHPDWQLWCLVPYPCHSNLTIWPTACLSFHPAITGTPIALFIWLAKFRLDCLNLALSQHNIIQRGRGGWEGWCYSCWYRFRGAGVQKMSSHCCAYSVALLFAIILVLLYCTTHVIIFLIQL
jgi:hypothetical protein